MNGHTPGPWHAEKLGKTAIDRETIYAIVSDVPSGWDGEANVSTYGGHMVAESVRERNAALMAAAPDMLEALEELMEWRVEIETDLGVHTSKAAVRSLIDAAEAAIAKARGEEEA